MEAYRRIATAATVAELAQASADPTAEYGVRFRQTGPSDYFMFSISGSGYYRLLQVKQGVYTSLAPWAFQVSSWQCCSCRGAFGTRRDGR